MSELRITVVFTHAFRKAIKHLRKKYPHIQDDVQPVIDQLTTGKTPGDQIPSTGYAVYKVRVPNRDARRGKSGGYRVIYYLQTESRVNLLTIYSKTELSDTSIGEIQAIIADLANIDDE